MKYLIVRIPYSKVELKAEHYTSTKYWTEKERHSVMAIRKISHGGGLCYEARLSDSGQWVGLYKSENRGEKIPTAKKMFDEVSI
jgi:hypothetical protein